MCPVNAQSIVIRAYHSFSLRTDQPLPLFGKKTQTGRGEVFQLRSFLPSMSQNSLWELRELCDMNAEALITRAFGDLQQIRDEIRSEFPRSDMLNGSVTIERDGQST